MKTILPQTLLPNSFITSAEVLRQLMTNTFYFSRYISVLYKRHSPMVNEKSV